MARAARLKLAGAPVAGVLAALLAVVLLVHFAALRWLSSQLEAAPSLRAMAPPMFTRVLKPQDLTPPPVLAPAMEARTAPPTARVTARAVRPRKAASHAKQASSAAPAQTAEQIEQREPPTEAASKPLAAASSAASEAQGASADAPAPEPAAATSSAMLPASQATASASAASTPASASATAVPIGPDGWPTDTRLSYRLGGNFRGELHGKARVQWLRQGDKYETRIDIDITLVPTLTLLSQGEVTAQSLFPRAYEERRGSSPRHATLGDDSITLNDGRRIPRPAGAQDTASQFVELSHRFASGQEALEIGRTVTVWLARPGGVDLWTYDVVGRESLRTPELGIVDAFHLKPRPVVNPRGNIAAEMWFAPSLQYLPVRIKVTMGEDTYVDLLVERIEQR
jgi:hypothetical protein